MVKKNITKEYLENRLNTLQTQQNKIETLIQQYTELWTKLSGAIELTTEMLEEFIEKPNSDDKHESK